MSELKKFGRDRDDVWHLVITSFPGWVRTQCSNKIVIVESVAGKSFATAMSVESYHTPKYCDGCRERELAAA